MPKKEVPIDYLQQYLPPGTSPAVTGFLQQYKVHLTIARERSTILGDYRHRTNQANHRISVNGNLNTYSFLLTLLHELAHLLTFEQYGSNVLSHGKEWKLTFRGLLKQFIGDDVFPSDIKAALAASLNNPAASSCAEEKLQRVLRKYNSKSNTHQLVEEILPGSLFRTKDGRVFRKGEKLRKRFKCTELKTGRMYLFSPIYEIELLQAV